MDPSTGSGWTPSTGSGQALRQAQDGPLRQAQDGPLRQAQDRPFDHAQDTAQDRLRSVQALASTWTAARAPLGKVAALNRGESYAQRICRRPGRPGTGVRWPAATLLSTALFGGKMRLP